jgi:hypothetical protein
MRLPTLLSLSSLATASLASWLALAVIPVARAATACGDTLKISVKPTIFDGLPTETIVLRSRTVTLETGTFTRWRPEEEVQGPAALTLYHQVIPNTRVDVCPLVPPDMPNTTVAWKAYLAATVEQLGEGTVVSREGDTTSPTFEGGRVLEWETREALFTHTPPGGGKVVVQFHLIACDDKHGLRFVLTTPPDKLEDALMDLRLFLN